LAERGIAAVTIRNSFDADVRAGDRSATRAALGIDVNELVVLQPTRAIPRKGIPRGIGFAETLAALVPDRAVHYWLTGPAEDGYGPTLDGIIDAAGVSVTQGRVSAVEDAYAAADLVVVPSSWEGFGNPVVEAMLAERPVVAAHYPALDELIGLGLRPLPIDDVPRVAAFVERPDPEFLRHNRAVAARELAVDGLPARLEQAFRQVGWDDW
jgi:glycosyltransferase involved in cell wall biosynthesis